MAAVCFQKAEVVVSQLWIEVENCKYKCLKNYRFIIKACHILARDKRSLEFTVNRSLMKLFQTSSAIIVEDCQTFFIS